MQSIIIARPYQFVPPHRGTLWARLLRPCIAAYLRKGYGTRSIECRGVEHLQRSAEAGHGILLTPNHCRPCDPMALGLMASLLGLWVLSLLAAWPPLFQAFGFAAPSWHAAVALFALGGGAFTFFLAPLGSWLSRRHEYQADRFSVRLARAPGALGLALVKLNGENLSNLHPHPWYSRWHYSHPTLLERLEAIESAGAAA